LDDARVHGAQIGRKQAAPDLERRKLKTVPISCQIFLHSHFILDCAP
jgi:hypothetical protein